MVLDNISGYIKTHERLIVVCVAALLLWVAFSKIQDVIINHDQKVFDTRAAELKTQADKNAELAKNNADAAAMYKALVQQVSDQNATLQRQTQALLVSLAQQKETDKHLAPPELAARIEGLAKLPPESVLPVANDTFTVTHAGAVGIASELENIPALIAQLSNSENERANIQKQLTALTALQPGLSNQIAGLQAQLVDADKTCKADIKLTTAKAARSKRKWFVAGFIVGFTFKLVTHF